MLHSSRAVLERCPSTACPLPRVSCAGGVAGDGLPAASWAECAGALPAIMPVGLATALGSAGRSLTTLEEAEAEPGVRLAVGLLLHSKLL